MLLKEQLMHKLCQLIRFPYSQPSLFQNVIGPFHGPFDGLSTIFSDVFQVISKKDMCNLQNPPVLFVNDTIGHVF